MRRLTAALKFTFLSAGQNFRRNLVVSMAGVFTMGLILVLVGAALLLTHSVGTVLADQQARASKLRVYIQDGVSLASISNFKSELEHDPRVIRADFETKEQAVDEAARRGLGFDSEIQALGSNPLPASINLEVKQLKDLQPVDAKVKASPLVEKATGTDYNADVIPKLQSFIFIIGLVGTGLALILAFVSLVIIMNTIRTAVFIRRTEIEIMKLVGATDWFVRWPFILEGVLGGVLAAIFSSIIVFAGYRIIINQAHGSLLTLPYDGGYLAVLVGGLFAGGAALGAFGSYLGVRRFLSV
ncbi:MAG: cell division protein FtsX [Candidatus Dormibacteria bacterium]